MNRKAFDQLFDMTDRVVVVTGGTRGIGLALAEGFVLAGARVAHSAATILLNQGGASRIFVLLCAEDLASNFMLNLIV